MSYNGEDVRGLVGHIVEDLTVLFAFGVAVDDILGDAFELLSCEGDGGLRVYMSTASISTLTLITHLLLIEIFLRQYSDI